MSRGQDWAYIVVIAFWFFNGLFFTPTLGRVFHALQVLGEGHY